MTELEFKHWLAKDEGVLSWLGSGIDKVDRGFETAKGIGSRLLQIGKKRKDRMPGKELIQGEYAELENKMRKLHAGLLKHIEDALKATEETPTVQTVIAVSQFPVIKQLLAILKFSGKLIGIDKLIHALGVATPKVLVKPFKATLDWMFKPETRFRTVLSSLLNVVKLGPGLSFTGAFKILIPAQMQWFAWSMEQAIQYNLMFAWGMYFIYILATLAGGSKWFDWFHDAVFAFFPDEFKHHPEEKKPPEAT